MQCKNKCGNETIHGRQICEECDKKDRELLDQIKNLGERSEPPHPLLSDVDAMIDRYNKDLLLLDTQLDKLKNKMCLSMTDKWNNKVKEIEICNARLQTLYILKGGMKK